MNQNDISQTPELSVGQILRQEREQRQLSLEQAAQQLNLRVEILRRLEDDQPDSNILPTFMRGYLKAYARFLKLPEQRLLNQFEQQHQVKSTPVKHMRTFSNRSAQQRTERRFMWLTWIIVTLIAASLALWFWQSAREITTVLEPVVPAQVTVPVQAGQEVSGGVSPALASDTTKVDTETAALTPELITSESVSVSEPVPTVVSQLPVAAQQQLAEITPLEPEPIAESFGDSRDVGLDRLKMTFTDNCWIDVLDADGERIAFGTKQAGYVMELNAKAPFVITLGNPGVVKIEFNQQPYDISRFPGNRVAKFTLPGQPD